MPDGTPYKAGTLDVELLSASNGAIDSIVKATKALRSLRNVLRKIETMDISMSVGKINQLFEKLNSVGVSESTILSIDSVTRKTRSLTGALKKMEDVNFSFSGQKLETLFHKISKATSLIDEKKLATFSSVVKSISSVTRIGKLQDVDFSKIAGGFNKLSVAITPFINKVKSAETSLVSLHGVIRGFGKIKGATEKGSSRGGIFSFLNLSKWMGLYFVGRRYGRVVQDIAQSGADYTETLNLWETSMRNNLTLATEFISKMNKAYGISEKTLMNAQATFNNMLGSLGQIDEATAYVFSEGITQMAVDYASLYNTTFEKAFEKFQSALAGQVRPIRSVSGFDITENTIYQLYQQLGGTKSVRNLSRTEKQLLSILAIYNQMQRSGAIGDLDKTMESYANQSRLMAESWLRAKAYAGSLLTNLIQQSGWMTRINANLIFLGDVLKAVAETSNAIQHFNNDPFAGFEASAEDANSAIDELSGKLLDFDKFRSLSGSDDDVSVDQALLNALTGIDGILENATSSAHDLAEELKIASGLFNKDGTFNVERWKEIKQEAKELKEILEVLVSVVIGVKLIKAFSSLSKTLASLGKLGSMKMFGITALVSLLVYAYMSSEEFRESVGNLIDSLKPLGNAFVNVANALMPVINLLAKIVAETVSWFDKNNLLIPALMTIVGIKLASWIQKTYSEIPKFIKNFTNLNTTLTKTQLTMSALVGVASFMVVDGLLSALGEDARRIVSPILALAGAISTLVVSLLALNGVMSFGTALPLIMGSVGVAVAGMKAMLTPEKYAVGASDIDSGTLFVAGEMGKTEAVYTGSNGKTNVANIQQMQSAFNGALNNWWSSAKHDIPQFREVSKTGIYEVAKGEMKRRGEW